MNIPPNHFRRDHPWTYFVLLDSSTGPVPSQAKVTHSLTLSLKKISNAHAEALRQHIALLNRAGLILKSSKIVTKEFWFMVQGHNFDHFINHVSR